MALPTTATCTYVIQPRGAVSLNMLNSFIGAIDLSDIDLSLLSRYGITLASDSVSNVAGAVVRTIVYNLQNAGSSFFSTFKTAVTWVPNTIYPSGSAVTPVDPNGLVYFASIPDTNIESGAIPTTFPGWQPSTAYNVGEVVIPSMENPATTVSESWVDAALGSFTVLNVASTFGFAASGTIQIQGVDGSFHNFVYTGFQPATPSAPGAFVGPLPSMGETIGPGAVVRQFTGVNLQNGLYYAVKSVTGDAKTGTTQPAYPVVVGQTVVDNHVTWVCAGSVATAQIGISGAVAPNFPESIGQQVIDNAGRNEIVWTATRAYPPDFAAPFYDLHTHAIKLRGCVQVQANAPVVA